MSKSLRSLLLGAVCVSLVGIAGAADAQDSHGVHGPKMAHGKTQGPPTLNVYPLNTDPVTGEALGEEPVIIDYEGRQLRFANQKNVETFRKDPQPILQKLDQRIIEQQTDSYPLETCPITGAKLGSMGEPVNRVYGNQLVRFCCAGCPAQFEENLDENLAKLNQAALEVQQESYPLETCVVSGEPLHGMGEPVDMLVNGQLVRLCCNHCKMQFSEQPAKYLEKIDAAREATSDREAKPAGQNQHGQHGQGHGGHQDQGGHQGHANH